MFNSSAVQQKKSDYVGEYFYENDTLKFINHGEGRVVTTNEVLDYQYFVKDHLDNVRITFTTKVEIDSAAATLETANAATEQGQFLNYDEAVKVNASLFDHTHIGQAPAANRTYYSVLLRGEGAATGAEKYGLGEVGKCDAG